MTVSRETRFGTYLALLQRWGRALNLTSARSNTEAALRSLIDDSLCVVAHLPLQVDRLIDLGSGQGFPAIPIAIETGIAIELIEADRRKAAFLTTVMAALELRGAVWPTRIEATHLPLARCVTAKALAPLATLVTLARPFLSPNGQCLFLKGPSIEQEVLPLQNDHTLSVELLPTARSSTTLVKVRYLG